METVRKGSAGGGSETSVLSALGQAGVWSTLGDVGGELATTLVSSALGSSAGNVFSSALGMAGMWEAVFADVGVSVLAILNASRALNTKKL